MLHKNNNDKKKKTGGTSLALQRLRLHASTAGGMGSILGGGTNILHAVQPKYKNKNKLKTGGSISEHLVLTPMSAGAGLLVTTALGWAWLQAIGLVQVGFTCL